MSKKKKGKQGSATPWFFSYFRIPIKKKHLYTHWKARCARLNKPMVQRFIEMMEEDVAKDSR